VSRAAVARHQDHVETDVARPVVRVIRKPCLGGRDDALLLARRDRQRGVVEPMARLDLDETSSGPRRATMSTSPTGLLNRRAAIA